MTSKQTVGGVDLAYYVICKRKLWLYKKGIGLELESDRVLQGAVLHATAYPGVAKKEIMIDEAFKIDAIEGDYVREIKLSSKMEKSDRVQMLFYLYQLSLRGVKKKGLLSYTKERKTVEVELTETEQKEMKKLIAEVYKVIDQPSPPRVTKLPYCKACAYYEFCYSKEAD
ncbi:CRISPR-associated protein Cas4 [Bacillus massilinigeriensis]|uniref:CRISPR-associated protein Cas4 n=1 Tax=Bacillus mediterraneensis TaxID=1805474 RepID=UPI0008F82436|nr:CRISPR-associated protein Cas4 [Bacillus mediterraneensis]